MLAILKLDGAEMRTSDPFVVRTLWKLLGTAVTTEDRRVLTGEPPAPEDWPP